jgi:Aspartyl protease/PDZ domain
MVNRSGPYWFILDTGSPSNVLDIEVARSLGIPLKDTWQASGAGESTLASSHASNVSFGIGSLEIKCPEIDVVPLNAAISSGEGRKVNGLLGYDFFKQFAVEIDYIQKEIRIHEPKRFRYNSERGIPFKIVRGDILVPARITIHQKRRISGTFLIDTAWRSALTFTSPFARKIELESPSESVTAMTGMGIGGPTIESIGRLSKLRLGRYQFRNMVANFSHAKAGVLSQGDFSGIIGGETLRRFRVLFDYSKQTMILKPNENFNEPFEFDMSGLFLTSQGSKLEKVRVEYVVENSAAALAGIQLGDIIESIDEQPVSAIGLETIRRMFKDREDKEHLIRIHRNGIDRNFGLVLRRII